MAAAADTTPRWILAALSLGHAAVFGWAATVLPWQRWTAFAAMTAALALAHAVTGLLAAAGSRRRRTAWRWTSALALAYLLIQTAVAAQAGTYVATLYGGLGAGVFAALAALWAVLLLLTLPLAAWGIAATGGLPRRRVAGATAALLAALFTFGLWRAAWAAAAQPVAAPAGDPEAIAGAIEAAFAATPPTRRGRSTKRLSLWTRDAVACEHPLDRPTAFVVYPVARPADEVKRDRKKPPDDQQAQARCVQADEPDALLPAIAAALVDRAAPGPIKIDLVVGVQPLREDGPGPISLLLRPGLDGVCDGPRCLLPWQLLGSNQFVTHTPLPFIEDLRFGADPLSLRKQLTPRDAPPPEPPATMDGLSRLVTASYLVDRKGKARPLPRGRFPTAELDVARLSRAVAGAEAHVLAAQAKDGRFRYLLQPFTGRVSWRGFAVPRQAGTTLALCELGTDVALPAGRRSLAMLAGLRRDYDDGHAVLHYEEGRARPHPSSDLGGTALPLIAFLTCRDRTGPDHDALIGALGRYLLLAQRGDGGFHPRVDIDSGDPIPGPDLLYAAGQAVYALVLLEDLARRDPEGPYPPADEIAAAVQRAMDYFADRYWSHGLRSFFFLEENWHCLAARAALGVHRHAGYERFCLDYVDFKRRLIMDETSGVSPELVGAYGFGNVLVPHNTPSAGFGEALSAAMAVRGADGERRPEDVQLLTKVLTFLVAQQWDYDNCFACHPDHKVAGGWSESVGSLDVRIDYTQHAWAALGHGARQLGLLPGGDGGE